jgi:CarD family transcriptional regulator
LIYRIFSSEQEQEALASRPVKHRQGLAWIEIEENRPIGTGAGDWGTQALRGKTKRNPQVWRTTEMPKTATKAAKEPKVALPFSSGDFVVYPAHGVGKVTSVESQTIAGQKVDLFVISFERDRMTLRVPVRKVENSGLRKLSTRKVMDTALTTLKGRARVKRAMWSRRAQEYEAKINSGDPVSIAEVVRDLHRGATQPEQSYSERQIYEQALERLAHEVAAVEKIKPEAATAKLEKLLNAA